MCKKYAGVFFNAACYITISHSVTFFDCLFIYVPEKNVFKYPVSFWSFKGNIIWTCAVEPVMSRCVVFISFAKKVAIDFCYFFFSVIGDIVLIEIMK